jgi:hypothetical protein
MIGFSAVVVTVTTILTTVPQAAALASFLDSDFLDPSSAPQEVDVEEVVVGLSGLMGAVFVPALISTIALTVLSGLLIVAVSNAVLGRKTPPGPLWRRTRSRVLALIVLSLLVPLVIALVFIACFVPAIMVAADGDGAATAALLIFGAVAAIPLATWLWVRWSLAAPAMLLEGQPLLSALRRSAVVVRGSFWRTLGILVLTGIIVATAAGLVSVPFSLLSGVVAYSSDDPYSSFGLTLTQLSIANIGTILSGAVVYPFQAAVTALLYVDLRMRKEGLDLELIRATEEGAGS